MTTNRAYLIVPKIIEQPTWGDHYIMKFKGWDEHPAAKNLIGQSYELSSESNLSLATDTKSKDFQPQIDSIAESAFPLEQVRSENTVGLLGSRGVKKFNGKLKTLIKFTQAKGNSFQLHVKKSAGNWLAKPESWYYFEKGKATLGIKNKYKINEYKKVCEEINDYMKSLSHDVETGLRPVSTAQNDAWAFIEKHDPYQFINTVTIPANSIVDIHHGGIHHSWEEDDKVIPNGNILYEVQVDVMDNVSTLRSFDKGKISDDGFIRELQIDEYFQHLDTSKQSNDPDALITNPEEILRTNSVNVFKLFDTQYYKLDKIKLSDEVSNEHTNTKKETFHHLFVSQGVVMYQDESIELIVGEGHSVFVPAQVGFYQLKPKDQSATILKTYL